MVDLDRFESQFRASVKAQPVFEPPHEGSVLTITDLDKEAAQALEKRVQAYLSVLGEGVQWTVVGRDDISSVKDMLQHVENGAPSLIVSYRHLFEPDKDLPHSLGTYADMLIQALRTPVLLMPNPTRASTLDKLAETRRVSVITDRIVGDQRLVNWGLRFVQNEGHLSMLNVEDDEVFQRYVDIISKIPDIDTDLAARTIEGRLVHEAEDFLNAWATSIRADRRDLKIETRVQLGHTTREYMAIASETGADLIVFNTRKDDQLAMHGVAYALAVELLDTPLLMI